MVSSGRRARRRARDVLVVHGGQSAGRTHSDTLEWEAGAWRVVSADGGPGPRSAAAMAWDRTAWRLVGTDSPPGALVNAAGLYHPGLNRLVLVGGSDLADASGDVWAWTGTTWQRVAEDAFPARQGHGVAYDPVRRVLVLTGGVVTPGREERHQDLWEWAGDAPAAVRTSWPVE